MIVKTMARGGGELCFSWSSSDEEACSPESAPAGDLANNHHQTPVGSYTASESHQESIGGGDDSQVLEGNSNDNEIPNKSKYAHRPKEDVDNVWIVPYIPAIREMVPWIVRGPLIPHTMWGPMAHRTMYCIVTKYRPDVAARVLSHNVVRIFVVGMLAAISPSTEEGCHAVQAALTAVCFAHALLVIVSRAYRVPALTALLGLQSVLLGLVACTPFMGGDTLGIVTVMAYLMIVLVFAESTVSAVVFVIELVLLQKTRNSQRLMDGKEEEKTSTLGFISWGQFN